MWLKLFLLASYLLLLLILSRVLETLSWCEIGYGGHWSRQLLDPMALSVAKMKALLEKRGVSYEHVVEKTELKSLVVASGEVTSTESNLSIRDEESTVQTNFTSGAHFIEQVEDAKDSVWLVQVVDNQHQLQIVGHHRWKAMRKKVSKFGVNTGVLDCSLDAWYCRHKNWQSPFLLLALPAQFEKKAAISMHHYSGPVRESVVMRWLRNRLAERLEMIKDPDILDSKLQSLREDRLNPEIYTVLFSQASTPPLFYSALSVKFPGRVKFSFVSLTESSHKTNAWKDFLQREKISKFPSHVVYSNEGNYVYGQNKGEMFYFWNMERFFRFLHPCLNDIFIVSFIIANTMALFDPFISNCKILKRLGKFVWCTFKYNLMVIMLWLPIIGLFQMPYLESVPLAILKLERLFWTSYLGTVLRGDYEYFLHKPVYLYCSFVLYLATVTVVCKKYRDEEIPGEDWFNYSNMNSLAQMRPNNFIGPVGSSGYDLIRGLEIFGSRLTQPSTWLNPIVSSEYIQYLPTFRYTPVPISELAANNKERVYNALIKGSETDNEKNAYHAEEKINQNSAGCDEMSGKIVSETDVYCRHCHTEMDHFNEEMEKMLKSSNKGESLHPTKKDDLSESDPQNNDFCATCCLRNDNRDKINSDQGTSYQDNDDSKATGRVGTSGIPPGYVDNHQCVICLEDYVPLTMLCGLPCGHVFHETCIFSWLNTDKHFCPMCRWPSYKIPDSVGNPPQT